LSAAVRELSAALVVDRLTFRAHIVETGSGFLSPPKEVLPRTEPDRKVGPATMIKPGQLRSSFLDARPAAMRILRPVSCRMRRTANKLRSSSPSSPLRRGGASRVALPGRPLSHSPAPIVSLSLAASLSVSSHLRIREGPSRCLDSDRQNRSSSTIISRVLERSIQPQMNEALSTQVPPLRWPIPIAVQRQGAHSRVTAKLRASADWPWPSLSPVCTSAKRART